MTIIKPTAAEIGRFAAGSASAARGPSRGEQEKREEEIGKLAEPIAQQLSEQFGEKAGYLILGAFLDAAGPGELPGPIYYGPWPKLLDAVIKSVRESAPAYGEALCAAAERRLVTDAKAQKLVPADYQPPKA